MLNLNDLLLFAHVVDAGSFTAAARHLGAPKSTLSKRVAALEAQLGVQLLARSPRHLALTEVGAAFMAHARAALIEAEAAEATVRQRLAVPGGTVRMTAAVPVAQFLLADHLPALALALPAVRLEIHASDRFVDLVQEGYDIAVRSHVQPLADSSLVQRTAGTEPLWLVAAPDYLERHGVPDWPEALAAHEGLLPTVPPVPWALHGPHGARTVAQPRVRMAADETVVLLRAAEAGLGITRLPAGVCAAPLAAGRLRRVLPDWTAGEITTTLLMPQRRSQLPGVRAVVEFLLHRLRGAGTAQSARGIGAV